MELFTDTTSLSLIKASARRRTATLPSGSHPNSSYMPVPHRIDLAKIQLQECDECGMRFTSRQYLRRHERGHTGESATQQPFECTECGKCFSTRQHLQRHKVTHTGERLFECDNCGKRFMHQGHLQRHQMAHAPMRARSSGSGGCSKRVQVRTTIPPEAADYLFKQYKLDSKPTPEQLEAIASRTRLKEGVVCVWFVNARTRERKGQLNVAQQSIRKRCPGCRLRFTYRRALENHLASKHADKFSRGEIHIDTLTDTDTERDDDSEPIITRSNGGSRKRCHTSFLPKQADYKYLFQQYKLDRNPAQEQLEAIASRTGLKPRVVQVWFRNARARDWRRERKGQLDVARQSMQSIRKRCPGCRLRFTYRHALEKHLASKHADMFSRGEINIDTLADTDTERDGDSAPIITRSSGGGGKQVRSPPTSFLPEQADYLFQQYKLDRFPAQEQLEAIASRTRLKPRVVKVWFLNARARERKGKLNVAQQSWPSIRQRCPVCRLQFYRSMLESHLATNHADMFSRGEIDIDTLADTDTERDGDSEPVDAMSASAVKAQSPSSPAPPLQESVVVMKSDAATRSAQLDVQPSTPSSGATATSTADGGSAWGSTTSKRFRTPMPSDRA